jgi:catechol 2,3-dioxygenase-like lactoylglutathione lyase family enzyme
MCSLLTGQGYDLPPRAPAPGTSDSFKTRPPARAYVGGMAQRFSCIGLVATDMAATLAFYRRLGIDIPPGADTQPHVEAALPGGVRILWDTVETIRSFDPGWTPPRGDGRVSLAFACDGPADVDKAYAELTGAGYEGAKEPWDAFWGQRYAIVKDPDGTPVDLFAPLSG